MVGFLGVRSALNLSILSRFEEIETGTDAKTFAKAFSGTFLATTDFSDLPAAAEFFSGPTGKDRERVFSGSIDMRHRGPAGPGLGSLGFIDGRLSTLHLTLLGDRELTGVLDRLPEHATVGQVRAALPLSVYGKVNLDGDRHGTFWVELPRDASLLSDFSGELTASYDQGPYQTRLTFMFEKGRLTEKRSARETW
jgi:hypothetical protein